MMIKNYKFQFCNVELSVTEVDDGKSIVIEGISNLPYVSVWRAADFLCKNNYNTSLRSGRVEFYAQCIIVNL